MKIRKLAIKNIASIESAELDFEAGALGGASLFLICGETGSGKTTILDCITLALYGKTPRYDGSGIKNPQVIGGYAFNDARQLVRRGAESASATLSLIGNDGKPYEATWSVDAISRGVNKGTLKQEEWRWRDCSEGGVTWTKVKECVAATERAVGLGFEQFCRTAMLAQGQFTRFLIGKDDDKAEILEKLTDTSRYSELGKAIAAKWAGLEADIKTLEAEIGRMTGLGEDRVRIEMRITELTARIEELGRMRQSLLARLQWLQRRRELALNAEAVKADLTAAFAALRAMASGVAREADAATDRLQALKAFLADSAGMAAMYESAGVILQALADVRKARNDKAVAERALEKCMRDLPGFEKSVDEANQALERAAQDLSSAEESASAEERKLESLGRNAVQQDRSRAEDLKGKLLGLRERLKGIEKMSAALSAREQANSARRSEIAELEEKLPGLKSEMEGALALMSKARKSRDDQKKLIEDGIEKLVADLNVGDTCPVCGGKIERLHATGHFKTLFKELDGKFAEAEKAFLGKERQYNQTAAAINALKDSVATESALIGGDRDKLAAEEAYMSGAARQCGLQDASEGGVAAAIDACMASIAKLDVRLEDICRQEKKARERRRALEESRKTRDRAAGIASAAEGKVKDLQARINVHKTAIAAERAREEMKLAEVSIMASSPGWIDAWENDPEGVERDFKAAADAFVARKADLPRVEGERSKLAETANRIAGCMSRAVERLAELRDVEEGDEPAESTAAVDGLLGRFEESMKSVEGHLAARPDDLADADTEESLAASESALKTEERNAIEERGRCQQQVADDDRCAVERQAKREAAERLKAERGEWNPIYACFGDAEGKKMRREIQSYVLANVLVKANYYLRQLSSRYELSCEGLTLSVNDAFECGAVRPVNTLSGGEQFLVSLALALGLAGMNDTGLGVDMLLIDEGFGTLSGEHLNSAIEALERLNVITGSRKVGVISHVERLCERIRTHIEVTRNGQAPSQVKVVVAPACLQ